MQFARDTYGSSNTECQFWNFTTDGMGQSIHAATTYVRTLKMYCACGVVHDIHSGILLYINGCGGNSYFMGCLLSLTLHLDCLVFLILYLHLQPSIYYIYSVFIIYFVRYILSISCSNGKGRLIVGHFLHKNLQQLQSNFCCCTMSLYHIV